MSHEHSDGKDPHTGSEAHTHSEGEQAHNCSGHNHNHSDGHSHAHHHGHDHGHHGHHHHFDMSGNKTGLFIALIITAGIMVLEFVGGLMTNSLALLSDSGHMLSDVSALVLSLVAVWFAARPASAVRTYGFHRFEILAALFNGVTLVVISIFIIWEAVGRMFDPPDVASGSMMLIAAVGLLANLASAWALLRKGDVHNNLNVRSAYLHVLGDALGSVGAVAAGLLIYWFDWNIADPIISIVVAVLIVKSAWGMLKHTVHILMEGTPVNVDEQEVRTALGELPGVVDVHDLHIWTITSGLDSLSCHLQVADGTDCQQVLQAAIALIEERFSIQHSTIQVESSRIRHMELQV